jgi:hypothetical protein
LFSFLDDDDDDGMFDDERQHTGRRTVAVAKMVGVDNSK